MSRCRDGHLVQSIKLTKEDITYETMLRADADLGKPIKPCDFVEVGSIELSRLREVCKEYNHMFGVRFKNHPRTVLGLLKQDFDDLFGEVLE